MQFYVACRKLNSVIIREFYLFQEIDEYVDFVGDAQVLSTVATISTCLHIVVGPSCHEKTAFTGHHGLYHLTCMLFGLKIVPTSFLLVTHIFPSSAKWQFALVYPDYIIISSQALHENINLTRLVLSLFQEAFVTSELK